MAHATPKTTTHSATMLPADPPAATLHLQLTSRTNLAITTCGAPSELRLVEELPLTQALGALKDAARLGYTHLVLDGGEPLLAASLPSVLGRAARLGFHTTLVTNGTLLHQTRRWSALAPHLGRVVLVLHGERAAHDALCAREGAFDHARQQLELVRRAGLEIGLRAVVDGDDIGALPALAGIARAEGATIFEPRLRHQSAACTDTFAEAVAQLTAAGETSLQIRTDLISRTDLLFQRDRFVPCLRAGHVTDIAPQLVVQPSGRVRPISDELPLHLMFGSLRHASLAEFAPAWLASGRARELIVAADRAWWALVDPDAPAHAHWASELGLHVTPLEPVRRPRDRTTALAA